MAWTRSEGLRVRHKPHEPTAASSSALSASHPNFSRRHDETEGYWLPQATPPHPQPVRIHLPGTSTRPRNLPSSQYWPSQGRGRACGGSCSDGPTGPTVHVTLEQSGTIASVLLDTKCSRSTLSRYVLRDRKTFGRLTLGWERRNTGKHVPRGSHPSRDHITQRGPTWWGKGNEAAAVVPEDRPNHLHPVSCMIAYAVHLGQNPTLLRMEIAHGATRFTKAPRITIISELGSSVFSARRDFRPLLAEKPLFGRLRLVQ